MVTDAEWAEMSRSGEVCSVIGCEGYKFADKH